MLFRGSGVLFSESLSLTCFPIISMFRYEENSFGQVEGYILQTTLHRHWVSVTFKFQTNDDDGSGGNWDR